MYSGSVGFACLGVCAQRALKVDPGPIAPIMSAIIMLTGGGAIALSLRNWRAVVAVLGIGTFAEVLGLFTSVPFGSYEYTDRWVPTISIGLGHRFPLLLPLAWLFVVGGSHLFLRGRITGWSLAVGTGAFAMAIDIPMERAMTDVFGYWQWLPPGPIYGAPLWNSLGWFLVALLASLTLRQVDSNDSPARLVLPVFCAFVAWNGLLSGFDLAWVVLLAFAILLALPKK